MSADNSDGVPSCHSGLQAQTVAPQWTTIKGGH